MIYFSTKHGANTMEMFGIETIRRLSVIFKGSFGFGDIMINASAPFSIGYFDNFFV
jgi:hypothetical protein